MESFGKTIIFMGMGMMIFGFLVVLGSKLGFGKFPGDILFKKGNVTFYFPLASSILLSIILSVIFRMFARK